MDVTTLDAIASLLPANDTASEPEGRTRQQSRRLRILELRELIEAGEYHVSASAVADAMLRSAGRAN